MGPIEGLQAWSQSLGYRGKCALFTSGSCCVGGSLAQKETTCPTPLDSHHHEFNGLNPLQRPLFYSAKRAQERMSFEGVLPVEVSIPGVKLRAKC